MKTDLRIMLGLRFGELAGVFVGLDFFAGCTDDKTAERTGRKGQDDGDDDSGDLSVGDTWDDEDGRNAA